MGKKAPPWPGEHPYYFSPSPAPPRTAPLINSTRPAIKINYSAAPTTPQNDTTSRQRHHQIEHKKIPNSPSTPNKALLHHDHPAPTMPPTTLCTISTTTTTYMPWSAPDQLRHHYTLYQFLRRLCPKSHTTTTPNNNKDNNNDDNDDNDEDEDDDINNVNTSDDNSPNTTPANNLTTTTTPNSMNTSTTLSTPQTPLQIDESTPSQSTHPLNCPFVIGCQLHNLGIKQPKENSCPGWNTHIFTTIKYNTHNGSYTEYLKCTLIQSCPHQNIQQLMALIEANTDLVTIKGQIYDWIMNPVDTDNDPKL